MSGHGDEIRRLLDGERLPRDATRMAHTPEEVAAIARSSEAIRRYNADMAADVARYNKEAPRE